MHPFLLCTNYAPSLLRGAEEDSSKNFFYTEEVFLSLNMYLTLTWECFSRITGPNLQCLQPPLEHPPTPRWQRSSFTHCLWKVHLPILHLSFCHLHACNSHLQTRRLTCPLPPGTWEFMGSPPPTPGYSQAVKVPGSVLHEVLLTKDSVWAVILMMRSFLIRR